VKRLLPTLLLAACGGTSAAQVVTGRVDTASFDAPPVEVRAVRGAVVVAASPVEEDGSFLLALGEGKPARLELHDGAGGITLVGDPGPDEVLAIEVCEPGAPIELGEVRFSLDACGKTDECRRSEREVAECREPGHHRPEGCEPPPPQCAEACPGEVGALGRCVAGGGRCDAERAALDGCLGDVGCTPACCERMLEIRDRACGVCPDRSVAAFPVPGPPPRTRPGCNR
jgi:hypothetical protein